METTATNVRIVEPQPLANFFVGKEVVNDRVKRYMEHKHRLLTTDMENRGFVGEGETRSIWYSKEYLETLLYEIKHYGGDGLRVYFGEYEDVQSLKIHPGQLCLLMVPTFLKEDGKTHEDIIIEHASDYDKRNKLRTALQSKLECKGFNVAAPNPPISLHQEPYFPYND